MGSDEITLGKVLGEGASAVVYEATDSQGRTVCVKQFKNSIKLEDVERMHRETEVLKRLNHPKIPRLLMCMKKMWAVAVCCTLSKIWWMEKTCSPGILRM